MEGRQIIHVLFLLFVINVVRSEKDLVADEDGSKDLLLCSCREGSKKNILGCIDDANGQLVSASYCLTSAREEIELSSCQDEQFCLFRWHIKDWTNCTASCGAGGTKSPILECRKRGNANITVEDDICQFAPKPAEAVSCNRRDCSPHAIGLGWSECSRTCGEGMKYKQVECKKILANGTEVISSDCKMEQILDLIKPCHNPPCELGFNDYLRAIPRVSGRRRRNRGATGPSYPVIEAGNANVWHPYKQKDLHALIGDRVSAAEGTKVFLKCKYGGKPQPRATWYFDGKRIDNQRWLPFQYSYKNYRTVLEIPRLGRHFKGKYACRIENKYGVVKASSEVRMLKAGQATVFSGRKVLSYGPDAKVVNLTIGSNLTVYDNTRINIYCPVHAYPYRLRVRWSVKGVASTLGIRRFGLYGTDLMIRHARKMHSGRYTCRGETALGSDSASSVITVVEKEPPRILHSNRRVVGKASDPIVNVTIGDKIIVEADSVIEIACPTTGKPTPKITWQRRGVPIQLPSLNMMLKEDGMVLAIRSIREDASDTYSCVARNLAGLVSAESKISVLPKGATSPKIEERNGTLLITGSEKEQAITIGQTAEVFEGRPLTLYCPVKGNPKADIIWQFEDRNVADIAGANYMIDKSGGALMIVQINKKVAGRYSCVASNPLGASSASSRVKILTSSQPNVISHGSDVKIGKESVTVSIVIGNSLKTSGGRKVKIICAVEGWPTPKVIWNKNGKPVKLPSTKMQIGTAEGSILILENAKEEDSGVYTCYAVNPAGVAMSSSHVRILAPRSPVITSKRRTMKFLQKNTKIDIEIGTNVTSLKGNILTIGCPFEGSDESQVQWTVDAQPVIFNSRVQKVGRKYLRIKNVGFFDSGIYVCKVWNSEGHDTEKTLLTVSAPHTNILKASSKISKLVSFSNDEDLHVLIGHNMTVTQGHNIFITCPVRSTSRPIITWMKGTKEIRTGPGISVEGEQLLLTDVRKDDSGTYSCFAKTNLGTSNSSTHLTVIVPTKPVIAKSDKDVQGADVTKAKYVTIGDRLFAVRDLTVEIKCAVKTGNPKPRISWFHNGAEIESNEYFSKIQENSDLLIPKLDASLQGVYKCVAENIKGRDEASTTIMIMVSITPSIAKSNKKVVKYLFDDDFEDSDDLFVKEPEKWLDISSGKSSGGASYKSDGSSSKSGSNIDEVAGKSKASGDMSGETSDISGASTDKSVDKSAVKESDGSTLKAASNDDKVGGKTGDLGDKLSKVSDNLGDLSGKSLEKSNGKETSTSTEKSDDFGDKSGKTSSDKSGTSSDKSMGKSTGKSVQSEEILKMKKLKRLEKLRRLQKLPITINVGDSLKSRSGRDVMIDCEANGVPKPRVMWTKDGEDLTASDRITIFNNGSLLIKKATEEDTGKFSCTVINNKGVDTVSSRLKFVDRKNAVVVAPEGEEKIEVHPNRTDIRMTVGTNVTTLNGNSLTLKCPSKGKPKPKITWYKDAIEVRQDGEKTSFGQNGELMLKFVNSDDAAKYTCVAENKYGRDKMSTVVNVAVPPADLILEPEEITKIDLRPRTESKKVNMKIGMAGEVLSGKQVTIECPTTGSVIPKITWMLNGKELKSNGNYKMQGNTLTIMKQQEGDYEFTCKADTFLGSSSMISLVRFVDPIEPKIKATKKDKVSTEEKLQIDVGGNVKVKWGSQLDINCPHVAIPVPQIKWYRNGIELTEKDDIIIKGSGSILRLPYVREEDKATYACEVANGVGKKALEEITVGVYKPIRAAIAIPEIEEIEKPAELVESDYIPDVMMLPMIKEENKTGAIGKNYSILAGMKMELNCPVAGEPKPEIVWKKGDVVIARNIEKLVLDSADVSDNGEYTCEVTNVFGTQAMMSVVNVMNRKEPEIPRDAEKKEKEVVSAVTGIETVGIDIGDDLQTLVGTEVTIKCPAVGIPAPEIEFYKDDILLSPSPELKLDFFHGVLTIKRTTLAAKGNYKCVARNSAGVFNASSDIELLMPIAPTIHEMVNAPTYDYDVLRGQGFLRGAVGNKNISAYPGTEVHIDCPAGGFPQPKIFWSKDGERLHPDGEFVKVTGNGTLVLPHLTRDMQGTYECFAVNVGGGSSRSINVKVTDPSPPKIAKASGSSDLTQTLKADVIIGQNVVVLYGADLFIQCPVKAEPKETIMWAGPPDVNMEDEGIVTLNGGSTLKISKVGKSSIGSYKCIASNVFGSDFAITKVAAAESLKPMITPVKENVTSYMGTRDVSIVIGGSLEAPAGVMVTITCPISGTPRPDVKWYFDGKQIHETKMKSGSAAEVYIINKLRLKDSGKYTCVAENILGKHAASTYVAVGLIPKIQSVATQNSEISAINEEAVTIPMGGKAVVTTKASVVVQCFAHGIPMPHVKWYKDGYLVDSTTRYRSLINGLLDIRSVSAVDDGDFTCVAKNKFGVRKASMRLIVVDPPRIVGVHENRTTMNAKSKYIQTTVGGSITLLRGVRVVVTCPTKGIPQPTIQWKRVDAFHEIDTRVRLTPDRSLQIDNISPDDSGTYVCTARNKAGIDEERITIYVAEPPSAKLSSLQRARFPSIDSTHKIVVSKNKSVTITCSVRGNPMPFIKWFKEGVEIRVDGMKYYSEGDELFIQKVSYDDAGTYRCVAENMAGINTAFVKLVVGEAPKITKGRGQIVKTMTTTLKALAGQSVGVRHHSVLMIVCEIKGAPKPVIMWNKNGEEVAEGLMVEGNRVLLLKDVSPEDSGNYTCMVENELGSDRATSEVIVLEPAIIKNPVAEDLSLHGINSDVAVYSDEDSKLDVLKGEETRVLCIAEGYPTPKIEWRRDMHEIEEQGDEVSWSERVSILNKGNKIVSRVYAVLTIKKTDRDIQVSCKAKNAAGKGIATVQLVIHDLPVAPYTGVWISKESGECDGACIAASKAIAKHKLECRSFGKKSVSFDQCDPAKRPSATKECFTKRCDTHWQIGPWEACSASCGEDGVRKRSVKCIFKTDMRITHDKYCNHLLPRKPRSKQPCNRVKCHTAKCVDKEKQCTLVKSLGYCKSGWSKRNCCLTCGYKQK